MRCSKLGSTPVEEWFERHGRRGPFEDERAPRYAGVYYWQKATDNEEREFKIKLTASDDEAQTLMVLRGGKEDVERMEREMELQEQGMVRVRGIFEGALK